MVRPQVGPLPRPPPRSPRPRHYSLQVVQHPLRARMCGFGDKVRPRHAHRVPVSSPPRVQGSSPTCARCHRQDGRPQRRQLGGRCRVRPSPPPILPTPCSLTLHSELDFSFFLVTVDLWSADGRREMNLVLHPSSSTDRHASTVSAKPKKHRGSIPAAASPRSDHPSPPSSHSTSSSAPEPQRPSLDSQVCMTPSPTADDHRSAR